MALQHAIYVNAHVLDWANLIKFAFNYHYCFRVFIILNSNVVSNLSAQIIKSRDLHYQFFFSDDPWGLHTDRKAGGITSRGAQNVICIITQFVHRVI